MCIMFGICNILLPIPVLLLTMVLTSHAPSVTMGTSSPPLRPRIYVYDLPPEVLSTVGHMGDMLVEQIKSGPFHEPDPEKADYFWIPGGGMYTERGNITRRQFVISIFMHVRSHHPWWNRTLELGQAR